MKTFFLTVVMALIVASGVFAVTTGTGSLDLYGRTNQVCPTLIPIDSSPLHLDALGENIIGCLAEWSDLYLGSDWIKRLNPISQSEETLLVEWGSDGGMLAGEGYIGWVDGYDDPTPGVVKPCTFPGVDISDTDLWISLPGASPAGGGPGGTTWIGLNYPSDKTVDYTQIVVTDGTDAYTMLDIALGNGPTDWLEYNFIYLDQSSQTEYFLPDEWGIEMRGGQMYRVRTLRNNLALIIPHPV